MWSVDASIGRAVPGGVVRSMRAGHPGPPRRRLTLFHNDQPSDHRELNGVVVVA
jgi:hypothetical protein